MELLPALRGGGDAVSSSPSIGWLLLRGPGSFVALLPPELLGGSCRSCSSLEGLSELDLWELRRCPALPAGLPCRAGMLIERRQAGRVGWTRAAVIRPQSRLIAGC